MSVGPAGGVTAAHQAGVKTGDAQLKKAAVELESVFYYFMVKAMRDTVPKDGMFDGGDGEEVMSTVLDQQLSEIMAEGDGNSALTARMLDELRGRSAYMGGGNQPAPASETTPSLDVPPQKPAFQPNIQAMDFDSLSPKRPSMSHVTAPAPAPQPAETGPDSISLKLFGRISSPFGLRKDPFTGQVRQHNGVDIAAPEGSPVRSAGGGKVLFSGERRGYGNLVIVDHGDGLETYYAHCSQNLVKQGETVKKGEEIAKVGHTGRATGPHLHFEVRRDGRALNPEAFLSG